MLYGVTPPELCLTTRSIIRAPQSESGFSASHVHSTQGFLFGAVATEPHDGREILGTRRSVTHMLLGEWLWGLVAIRCDGPLEWEGVGPSRRSANPEPARGM